MKGGGQEYFEYDAAGRLTKTNAGDGVIKFYIYDGAGAATMAITSTGADLATEQVHTAFMLTSGVAKTISVYDKRGQATSTIELQRQLVAGGSLTDLTTAKTYNAFGEVASETDARGNTTNYAYNAMGRLIEKQSPTVSVTAENGAQTNVRPTEWYYYDGSGRYIGMDDANGHRTTLSLLAATGYDGEEAKVTAEFHPDAGVKRTAYDVFGDARTLTDEENRVTHQAYDKMGRLVQLTTPSLLKEHYAYDQLGQRTQHWNNVSSFAGAKERTDYDLEGRVTSVLDYEGRAVTYAYAWNGSLSTSGLGAFGGWTKTTTQYGATASESTDIFGRVVSKVDYSGATNGTYSFTFDKAGRLVSQTGGVATTGFGARNLAYTYFNTGQMASQADSGGQGSGTYSLTSYGYDAVGNKTAEKQDVTIGGVTKTFQNATSTYDAMNRRLSISESGQSITYEYDAAGNQRREQSTGDDRWFKYDSLNRMVTVDGAFSGTRGSGTISGLNIEYDASGRRMRTVRTVPTAEWATNTTTYTTPAVYEPATDEYSFYLRDADIVWSTRYTDPATMDEYVQDNQGNWGVYPGTGPGPHDGESFYWCANGLRHTDEVNIPAHTYAPGTYTGWIYYNQVQRENYTYNADGYLTAVTSDYQHENGSWATAETVATDTRDALGRSTGHYEYADGAVTYSRDVTYDKASNVLTEATKTLGGQSEYEQATTNSYVTTGGAYLGGQVVSSTSTNRHRTRPSPSGAFGAGQVVSSTSTNRHRTRPSPSGAFGAWTTDPNVSTANSYILRDGPLLSASTMTTATAGFVPYKTGYRRDPAATSYTSTYKYDANGALSYVAVADGQPRMLTYLTNAEGQRVWTKETAGTTVVTGLACRRAAGRMGPPIS